MSGLNRECWTPKKKPKRKIMLKSDARIKCSNTADKPKQTAVSKNKTNKFSAEPNTFSNIAYFILFFLFSCRCHIPSFFPDAFLFKWYELTGISFRCYSKHLFFLVCECMCDGGLLQNISFTLFFLSLSLTLGLVLCVMSSVCHQKFLLCFNKNFFLIFCRFSVFVKWVICLHSAHTLIYIYIATHSLQLKKHWIDPKYCTHTHTYYMEIYFHFACVVFWRTKCTAVCNVHNFQCFTVFIF